MPAREANGRVADAGVARHRLFIDGAWAGSQTGELFDVVDPAHGRKIAEVAAAGAQDVDLAVAAARRAFDSRVWSGMSHSQRAAIMWRLGDLIDAHADELALIEARDVGKPYRAGRSDIAGSADRFRYFAGWVSKITGETLNGGGILGRHAYTVREPAGVAALITAWNFPLFQAANKIAPALAAGCTVVIKPAEQAPLSIIRLMELAEQAGVPAGVVNLVTGLGATTGAALAAHAGVDKISFTGSTATGRRIIEAAKANFTRLTLELGGKSPVIVFDDADLDKAIPAIAANLFNNAGQVCSAGTRLFVQEGVYERVVDGLVEAAKALRQGDPTDPETDLGPLVSEQQLRRVMGYCGGAVAQGARAVTGGDRLDREGFFMQPTILAGLQPDMPASREEIFGPVLGVARFGDASLPEVARLANDTEYGLAAYIWTRDAGRAITLPRLIRSGLVIVNNGARDASVPNGGFKQSGWGREHGFAAVEAYTELKSIVIGT